MAKTIKMCDMSGAIVSKIFEMFNRGKVRVVNDYGHIRIVTDVEPNALVYPDGWYYAKGSFRNKHTSTTGIYEEIPMVKSNGEYWDTYARYCTLDN